jgi:5,10-methenyltetrahydrofolate synthetase
VKTFSTLRQELLEKRLALSNHTKLHQSLETILSDYLSTHEVKCLGLYWPIKGEFDPRPCALDWVGKSSSRKLALPIVRVGQPLIYGTWESDTTLAKGHASIPEPILGDFSQEVFPDLLLLPCLGWSQQDNQFWRIGYGGGYYDRTLKHYAELKLPTTALGLAFNALEVKEGDWRPQLHDQPLTALLKA